MTELKSNHSLFDATTKHDILLLHSPFWSLQVNKLTRLLDYPSGTLAGSSICVLDALAPVVLVFCLEVY
jgi:hypothetical protein